MPTLMRQEKARARIGARATDMGALHLSILHWNRLASLTPAILQKQPLEIIGDKTCPLCSWAASNKAHFMASLCRDTCPLPKRTSPDMYACNSWNSYWRMAYNALEMFLRTSLPGTFERWHNAALDMQAALKTRYKELFGVDWIWSKTQHGSKDDRKRRNRRRLLRH